MGLPVIATNWSGPAAFLSEETGHAARQKPAPHGEARAPGAPRRRAAPAADAARARAGTGTR